MLKDGLGIYGHSNLTGAALSRLALGVKTNDVHRLLRERTQPLHIDVEAAFAVFDLRAASGYRSFLMAQAGAVLPLERWVDERWEGQVDQWPARRRSPALVADLDALGVSAPPEAALSIEGHPLGVAYVLEGSRLGARVLARAMLDGATVSPSDAMRFLGEPRHPALWQSLLDQLGAEVSPSGLSRLVEGAEAAFAIFKGSAAAVALQFGLEHV